MIEIILSLSITSLCIALTTYAILAIIEHISVLRRRKAAEELYEKELAELKKSGISPTIQEAPLDRIKH